MIEPVWMLEPINKFNYPRYDFNEFQKLALQTSAYPVIEGSGKSNLIYPALGLAGESGEYVDKVKKLWRNQGMTTAEFLSDEEKLEFVKELGDILWYVSASARELGVDLGYVAAVNIQKIMSRRARGVVKGEGDNR